MKSSTLKSLLKTTFYNNYNYNKLPTYKINSYTTYKLFCNKNNNTNTNNTTTNKTNTTNNTNLNDFFRSFGEQTVKSSDHQGLVNNVFSSVAGKYDIMNDAMSFGVHRLWKHEFINKIGYIKHNVELINNEKVYSPLRVIDVAGGTGDISFKIYSRAEESYKQNLYSSFPVKILVVDINADMLEEGKKRAESMNLVDNTIDFKECNAEALDFLEDNSVDLYTISFGIRNCTRRFQVLNEAYRVLKPGGRFLCMEFSKVEIPVINQIYEMYSTHVIPEIGSFIAGDKASYTYLVESIRKFPSQEDFKDEIESARFNYVHYTNLSGGICAIHSGIKI